MLLMVVLLLLLGVVVVFVVVVVVDWVLLLGDWLETQTTTHTTNPALPSC